MQCYQMLIFNKAERRGTKETCHFVLSYDVQNLTEAYLRSCQTPTRMTFCEKDLRL